MAGASFILEGLDQLERNLDDWPANVQKRVLKKSIRAGYRIIRKEMLKQVRAVVNRRRPKSASITGPHGVIKKERTIRKVFGLAFGPNFKKAPHALLLEEGTAERFTASGAGRGKVTARHPYKTAFDNSKARATKTILDKCADELEKEAAKLPK